MRAWLVRTRQCDRRPCSPQGAPECVKDTTGMATLNHTPHHARDHAPLTARPAEMGCALSLARRGVTPGGAYALAGGSGGDAVRRGWAAAERVCALRIDARQASQLRIEHNSAPYTSRQARDEQQPTAAPAAATPAKERLDPADYQFVGPAGETRVKLPG